MCALLRDALEARVARYPASLHDNEARLAAAARAEGGGSVAAAAQPGALAGCSESEAASALRGALQLRMNEQRLLHDVLSLLGGGPAQARD
jgi:hypothetical protein